MSDLTLRRLAVVLCAGWSGLTAATAAEEPAAPTGPVIRVSAETTHVTEPLDAEGYVDYIAALNALLGKGVTADENAAIPLLQGMGVVEKNVEFTNLLRVALGLPEWKPGDLDLLSLNELAVELSQAETDPAARGAASQRVVAQNGPAMERPWVEADFPAMADLLKRNTAALQHITTGLKRPKYFRPYVRREPNDLVVAILLPDVQEMRDVARQLNMRVMLHLGHGRLAEAREDLLSMHRLGVHASRGGTIIEGLVGIAIDSMATAAGNRWAEMALKQPREVTAYRTALAAIPVPGDFARQLGTAERFMGLDMCQALARGRTSATAILTDTGALGPNQANSLVRADRLFEAFVGLSLDWNTTMVTLNRQYDALVEAGKMTDPLAREQKLLALEAQLKAQRQETVSVRSVVNNVLGGSKFRGATLGNTLGQLLLPAVVQVYEADNRIRMRRTTLLIGLASIEYFTANGAWPDSLEPLVAAKTIPAPIDVYTGSPLQWKVSDTGFRVYSIGKNRKDDGGRTFGSMHTTDDIPFAIPVPADNE